MSLTRRTLLAGMTALTLSSLGLASAAHAVTVKDDHGELTLDKAPTRIVALEFSFVDALANVGISPVGVADDNQVSRVIEPVRKLIQPWKSVGTRSQPNMETIAGLKPDLIIADTSRHKAAYDQLRKIAPVLLLDSRYGGFTDILNQEQIIGDVVGKSTEMKAKITELQQKIKGIAGEIKPGQTAMFGASRENTLDVHTGSTFAGGLLTELGFKVPDNTGGKDIYDIDLEHVLAMNPDWMFIAHYRQESVVRKWEQESLWKALTVARQNQLVSVDPQLWARSRGITAASLMADQVKAAVEKH